MQVKNGAVLAAVLALQLHVLPAPVLAAEGLSDAAGFSFPVAEDGSRSFASLFTGIDVYGGLALKRSGHRDAGEAEQDVRMDSAVRLRMKDLNLILSGGLPYTGCAELGEGLSCWETARSLAEQRGVVRSGISFRIADPRISYEPSVCFGNLHFAGAVIRLKQPCRPVPWNFGSLSLEAPGLSAALPGFTSAESPAAFSLAFRPVDQGSPLPSLEVAVVQGGDVYLSVYRKQPVPLSRSGVLSLAVNGGSFVYGGKEGSAWFYKEPFYRERRYLSADAELGFSLERTVSASCAAGFSENPFAGLADSFFWHRERLAVAQSFWALSASHFAADASGMILPGGNRLQVKRRLSLNPAVRIPFAGGRASLALLGTKDERQLSAGGQDLFRFGAKGSFRIRRCLLDVQYTDRFSPADGEEEPHVRQYGFRFSYRGSAARTATALTLRQDGEKETVSLSQTLYPKAGILTGLSVGGSAVFHDGAWEKLSVRAGAGVMVRAKYGSIQGKFLYTSTFYGDF